MAVISEPARKLSFTFDSSVAAFDVPSQTYRLAHEDVEAIASGALVFRRVLKSRPVLAVPVAESRAGIDNASTEAAATEPGTTLQNKDSTDEGRMTNAHKSKSGDGNEVQDVILLVQRAAHDSMPLLWETPGGAVDHDDPTVLYGMARELREEAGLKASHVVAQAGQGYAFFTRRGPRVHKFSFEVEVEIKDEPALGSEAAAQIGKGEEVLPTVTLSDEHEGYMWATEEECLAHKVGDVDFKFTHRDQEGTILDGFRARKERLAKQPTS
jgi:8-oxo-dGTP pyrophosphatase MutT (NUDIX family)